MLGIAMADDAASLQLAHVIAEAVVVATISTLGVRVGVLVLLRPQLTDRIVARACARASSLCKLPCLRALLKIDRGSNEG